MARDRFIYWKDEKPQGEELQFLLEDYVYRIGKVEWNEDLHRFYVSFPGPGRRALARLGTTKAEPCDLRFIEVYVDPDGLCIDIITREQDDIVSAIAAGLAKIIVQRWAARLDEG